MSTRCKTGTCKKGTTPVRLDSQSTSLKPCFSCQKPQPPKKEECKHPVVEPICCAEGRILISDDCGREFEIPFESRPSDVAIVETVEALSIQLEALITKATPVTTQDITDLEIVCDNSTLTTLPNVPAIGNPISTSVGEDAVAQLVLILNRIRSAGTITASEANFRVQSSSLLFLTIQLFVGNVSPPTLQATLSGQFHIEECGRALCFDWANLNYIIPPTN